MARVSEGARAAPTTVWDPSSALRWLPAAVYPATAGPPGHGAGEGTKTRAAGSSAWPASVPTHVAARRTGAARACPVVPPRGREPGATASAFQALRSGCGCVCREGGTRGLGLTKARGRMAGGGGSRLHRTAALMKCRLGSPRRRSAHLEMLNAIGKSRANRQNFY